MSYRSLLFLLFLNKLLEVCVPRMRPFTRAKYAVMVAEVSLHSFPAFAMKEARSRSCQAPSSCSRDAWWIKRARKELLGKLNTTRGREVALWGLGPGGVSRCCGGLRSLPGPRLSRAGSLGWLAGRVRSSLLLAVVPL